MTRPVLCTCLALGVAHAAHAGPIELEQLYFQLDYGVFADGGSTPLPLQGPQGVSEAGVHDFTWSQQDGVAFAEATALATVLVEPTPMTLSIGGGVETTAFADVGDDPDYPFETGIAQAYFDFAILTITLEEHSLVDVTDSSVFIKGVGLIEPGAPQVLEPGSYFFEYDGGFDTGASVEVGAGESAFDEGSWSFGMNVSVVPAPCAALLCLAPLVRRRSR